MSQIFRRSANAASRFSLWGGLGTVVVLLRHRRGAIAEAVRRLDAAGVDVADLSLRRPTLDDVFLVLTGRAAEQDEEGEDAHGAEGQGDGG